MGPHRLGPVGRDKNGDRQETQERHTERTERPEYGETGETEMLKETVSETEGAHVGPPDWVQLL